MNDTPRHVQRLLLRELEGFARELGLFPDEDSIWQTVPGITNSAGTLTLHVAGNLQHFIGAILGGTDYTRDRELELSGIPRSRVEVAAEIDAAIRVVDMVLSDFPAARMENAFPGPADGPRMNTGLFLSHLVAHTAYHLGQVGYLRRALTGDPRTTDSVSLKAITD